MDSYRDQHVASEAAGRKDMAGGLNETRLDSVWRRIRDQFVVI